MSLFEKYIVDWKNIVDSILIFFVETSLKICTNSENRQIFHSGNVKRIPKKVCQWLFKFCPNFKDSKDFRTFLWLANTWAQLLICSWFPYTDQECPQYLRRNQLELSWHLGWIPGKLCFRNKSWQLQCPLHMHCKCSHLPFRFSFWKLVFWGQIRRATSFLNKKY